MVQTNFEHLEFNSEAARWRVAELLDAWAAEHPEAAAELKTIAIRRVRKDGLVGWKTFERTRGMHLLVDGLEVCDGKRRVTTFRCCAHGQHGGVNCRRYCVLPSPRHLRSPRQDENWQ
jgi:hypothetical protein